MKWIKSSDVVCDVQACSEFRILFIFVHFALHPIFNSETITEHTQHSVWHTECILFVASPMWNYVNTVNCQFSISTYKMYKQAKSKVCLLKTEAADLIVSETHWVAVSLMGGN